MATINLPSALYSAAQARAFDHIAITEHHIPGYTLMCRAGAATVQAINQYYPKAKHITVLCGAGNNGGDGYIIARLLQQQGLNATVCWLAEPNTLSGDAVIAWQDAKAAGVKIKPYNGKLPSRCKIIVDALFGTGLNRAVTGRWSEAIHAINQHQAPVVAVDIPSGLHADTGVVLGCAVKAAVTVSFIALKQGLFTGQGPAYCGEIIYHKLAVPEHIFANTSPSAYLYAGDDLAKLLARRPADAHKGDNGHVLVIGGDHGMAGAVIMAGTAAARCGSGLVTVATHPDHAAIITAYRPELMSRGIQHLQQLHPLLERATVIVIGPGLGQSEWSQKLFQAAIQTDKPMVVDADGLNLLAQQPLQNNNWVLTPHPGEAARLLQRSSKAVQADRFAAAKAIVKQYGGVSVLKGAGSLVASKDIIQVNNSGNPGMASGGMGDVLSGVIAALLAQKTALYQAALNGVFIHGKAADLAAQTGERGMLACDLLPFLRQLVNP